MVIIGRRGFGAEFELTEASVSSLCRGVGRVCGWCDTLAKVSLNFLVQVSEVFCGSLLSTSSSKEEGSPWAW